MHVGAPVIPVSPSYSLVSKSFAKLRSIVGQANPAIIFVDDYQRFQHALASIRDLHRAQLVVSAMRGAVPHGAVAIEHLSNEYHDYRRAAATRGEVGCAYRAVSRETVAKVLFTSGSTDEPKGVINTQRMLCSNQEAKAMLWPFLKASPPTIVDWLPWNHTFGGNHNFNMVLRNGGTLYIDEGRPTSGGFGRSIANLTGIAPTIYFNVPRGYELLVPALRADGTLRRQFFSRLQLLFYAAASLPKHLWEALRELSIQQTGRVIPMLTSWGATETAPLATDCYFQTDGPGVVGLPIPGCRIKLVPEGGKLEARVSGPQVTPGYWGRPDLTADRFDEEGFYRSGDAFTFVDRARPVCGLIFDGRLSEDFKLSTGTWVSVGALRLRALELLAPLAQDIVVAGHDRAEIGFLIFPSVPACVQLSNNDRTAIGLAELPHNMNIRARVRQCLSTLRELSPASSTHATRAILLPEIPSVDAGEITDKGYLNQRRCLAVRASYVEQLFAEPGDSVVIKLDVDSDQL